MATDTPSHADALRRAFREASLFDNIDPTACAIELLQTIDHDLLTGMRNVARILGPTLQMAGAAIAERNASAPVRARPTVVGPDDATIPISQDELEGED